MIITCPNCSTRFMLEDDQMPDAGRKVRCARCAHVWHADANAEPAIAPREPAPAQAPVKAQAQAQATSSNDTTPKQEATKRAAVTPELEKPTAPVAANSSKTLVWVLAVLVVLGGAIGGTAYFMPKEFQALTGLGKPKKPSVVTTKESWASPRVQPTPISAIKPIAVIKPIAAIKNEPPATDSHLGAPASVETITAEPQFNGVANGDANRELPTIQADETVIFSDEPMDMGPLEEATTTTEPQIQQ